MTEYISKILAADNIVLAKCGVECKIENVKIFSRRCFFVLIIFVI